MPIRKDKSLLLWMTNAEWAAIQARTKPREATKFVREAIQEKLGMTVAVETALPADYAQAVHVLAAELAAVRPRSGPPEIDTILEKFLAHNPHIAEMPEPEKPSRAGDNLPVDWNVLYKQASEMDEGEALRMLRDRTAHIKLPSGFWRMPSIVQRKWLETNT